MQISMFGPLTVRDGDRRLDARALGGRKPRQLLEILLLARGRAVSKDVLADLLWPDSPPLHVDATLYSYVCVLRRALTSDTLKARRIVVTDPSGYRLATEEIDLDLDRFDRLALIVEGLRGSDRRPVLEDALVLVRGDLLEDEPFAPWVQAERAVYRDRATRTLIAAASCCLTEHDHAAAIRHSEGALRLAPYSEDAVRILMSAHHELGFDDLARAVYDRWCDALETDLGLRPSRRIHAVAGAIGAVGARPLTHLART